ncbi:MAG: hypothetical protein KID07_06820 [Firmicutes bacterium]|nr:hypothetical protein [Bacillota bacterium]
MTTLWETQTLDDLQAEEARKHNAMIRERYRLLQNAEEAQLEKTFAEAEQQKRAEQFNAPAAPVEPVVPAMPEAPAAPVVKTQERAVPLTAQQKDLFTADTFRRVVSGAAEAQAAVQTPVQAPAFRPVYVPGEAKEQVKAVEKSAEKALESYSLTNAAKAVIAAVAAFVVLLIALIGVNTRILNAKGAELTMLEEKKAELVEQSRELANRIEKATSEETIAAWAQANGWTK